MKKYNLFSKERRTLLILILVIFIGIISTDYFIINSSLFFPLITSTVISALVTKWCIPHLRSFKLNQIIREEGPSSHHKKSGTPTMGGLIIVPIGILVGNLINISKGNNDKLFAISLITLAYMIIGSIDDWKSFTKKTNTGLKPKSKLILQSTAAIIFLIISNYNNWINTNIQLINQFSIDIGLLIWPLALFVFLAVSNSTNLTDGLDGLLSGCGALVFCGLGVQLMLRDNLSNQTLAYFCMGMAGAWIGFLVHNHYPAKVFMGDTGSLAIGAALSAIAIFSNSLLTLLIMGGVFLIEAMSVILQVSWFKISKLKNNEGRRLLLMAPLHHHYELAGLHERTIVKNFWLITLGLVLMGLIIRPTT